MNKAKSSFVIVNSDSREYSSNNEILDYLESEAEGWRWLIDLPSLYQEAGEEIFKELFKSPIDEAKHLLRGSVRKVSLGGLHKYVEVNSSEGVLVRRTRQEYGDLAAALCLVYLNKNNRNLLLGNPVVKKFVENPNLAFDRSVAIQVVLSLHDFISEAWDARSSELRNQLERFSEHTALARNAVNGYAADLTEEIIASKARVDSLGMALGKAYARRKKVYSQFAAKARQAAKNSVQETVDALESAKAAYHDQVDLNASVQYWSVRKDSHSLFKFIWFFAVVVSMVSTFISMLAYYGYGGAAGLSHMLREQSSAEALNQVSIVPSATSRVLFGQNATELSLAIADLAGAALLITLFGVIIKITLRQFNTHSHLSLEAAERITFKKTYLALLNEGKLKSDEDRRLILESLFRSTQSGSIAEIPFSSPIELILKTLGEKKPV